MKIKRGRETKPRRVFLYGVEGIGKSSWANQAPDTLFLDIEDGLSDIDCAKSPHITSLDQFNEAMLYLANEKHEFKTVAVDSADWLEGIIHAEVANVAGKKSIADIGFGAGYKQALSYWDKILFRLDWLRTERGMNVIFLAHSHVKRHQDPEQDSYDRFMPALHETASAMIREWCDEVLFASYRVFIRKEDQGFGKERSIPIGSGERYLRTQESAACLAKSRLRMPSEIEFSWAAYASFFSSVKGESNG